MPRTHYTFDGQSMKNIDPWHSDGAMWKYNSNAPETTDDELYAKVAAVYRAINFTADTLSNMPFAITREGGAEVDTSEEYKNEVGFWPYPRQLLRLMVQSFLVTNKAYAFQETKGSKVLNLRYIAPSTIQWITDPVTGELRGFKRTLKASQDYMIDAKKFCNVVYAFNLNWKNELLPDDNSPFKAMCNAAGIGYYADTYIRNFFSRGGIKPTILTFDGVLSETDKERVESVWTKIVTGYYRFLGKVFNGKFTPTVIGEGIEALKDQSTYDNALRNIAIAVGMPQDALLQNADSYATAQVHKSTWFSDTLTPLSQSIAEPLNEQVFKRLGYRFEFRPETADPDMEEERQRIASAEVLFNILSKGNRVDADKAALEALGIDLPQWFKWEEKEPEPIVIGEGQAFAKPGEPNPFGGGGKAPKVDAPRARVSDGKEEKHYPGGQDHEQQNHAGDGGGGASEGSEENPTGIRVGSSVPAVGSWVRGNYMGEDFDGVVRGTQGHFAPASGARAQNDELIVEVRKGPMADRYAFPRDLYLAIANNRIVDSRLARKSIGANLSLPAMRELNNWQELAFRKLKRGQSLAFEWEPKDISAEVAAQVKAKLDAATTEDEIKAAFELPDSTDNMLRDDGEIKTLADAMNKLADSLFANKELQNG